MTRILVIEDDRAIRELLRDVLSDEGHELVFVEDLEGAAADAAPNLVITDLVGTHGYERGRARAWVRRAEELYPATPIIVCTGYEQALEESARLGAAAVLSKPFSIDALVQTVARLVARPREER